MNLYKRKNSYYYIKYKDDLGREIHLSTKSKRKRDALIFLSTYESKLTTKPKHPIFPLNHVTDYYLNFCRSRYSSKYHSIMKYSLDKLSEFSNNAQINTISSKQCEEFIMIKYGNAKYLSNQFYRNIRTFFNWAVDNNYLKVSPIQKIKPPKVPKKNPEWLKEEELLCVLNYVDNENLMTIYKLLFYTGLRTNELLSLTWANVNLDSKIVYIRSSDKFMTKTLSDRTLPLNEKSFCLLSKMSKLKSTDLLFTKNGRKYNVDYISKVFKKAVRNTELNQNIHLHSLRHSYASNLVAKGASLYHVSKLLGHARISTTEKYSHLNLDDLRVTSDLI